MDIIGPVNPIGSPSKPMAGPPDPPESVSTLYGTPIADMGISITKVMIVAPNTNGKSLHAAAIAT